MEILQTQNVLLFFLFSLFPLNFAFTSEETEFINDYFKKRNILGISVYPCSKYDASKIMRTFHQISPTFPLGFGSGYVKTSTSSENDNDTDTDSRYAPPVRDIRSRGILVDIRCSQMREVVQKASSLALMTDSLHWLLWSTLPLEDELDRFLQSLPLNIDADVVLAVSGNEALQLYDLFKTAPSGSLTSTFAGAWDLYSEKTDNPNFEEILRQIRRQRYDFQGLELRAAVVLHGISADPKQRPVEFESAISSRANRHLDSESRFGYSIYRHLQEVFNFTMSIEVTDSWGYRNNGTNFDGMVGMLQRGQVELGITPAIFNEHRLQVADFTTPTWRLRTCFLFRHPRLLVPYKALAEPFVATTWGMTFLFSVLVVLLLHLDFDFENRLLGHDAGEKASWIEPVLTVIAVISQQGAPNPPRLASGRIILLTKLVLSLLLYAFYTSAIVTFLLTPVPRTIRTAQDLLHSPLTLGLEDYSYNRAIFPHSNDSLISRIWREKVSVRGGGFLKVADAVHRMRSEHFAFYSEDTTVYVPIDETFDDSEKCDLSEVELSAPKPTGAPLQKNSPYRELFNRALLRMWERGVRSRLRNVWSARKPQCLTEGTTAIAAVGLDPIFPAHALLLAGFTSAVAILFREKMKMKNDN